MCGDLAEDSARLIPYEIHGLPEAVWKVFPVGNSASKRVLTLAARGRRRAPLLGKGGHR